MRKKMLIVRTMAIIVIMLYAHTDANYAMSQPQRRDAIARESSVQSESQSNKSDNVLQRVELVEYKLEAETRALEKRFEDFSRSVTYFMSFLSIFVALLTIFSIYRSWQQHRDYVTERNYFSEQVRNLEAREKPFEGKQLENMEKLNAVIGLVEKSFSLQHEREKAQSTLIDELKHMKDVIAESEREAEEKYRDARDQILSLEDVKAMDWPRLTDEAQNIAAGARNRLEGVSKAVLRNEEKTKPYDFAKVMQLIGISAFYTNNIASAFHHLGDADRVYEANPARNEDALSRAYTKHFLGVAAKNWRKHGDVSGGNIKEASDYLWKANEMIKDDPKQFLIPVTQAEVLSYIPDRKHDASSKLDEILDRFNLLRKSGQLDVNQQSLLVRTYLLKGNLAMKEKQGDVAGRYYEEALTEDRNNAFAQLSLLHARRLLGEPATAEQWANALALLERSGTTRKRETVTRVTALVWAIIAAQCCGDMISKEKYFKELNLTGPNLRRIAQREPLFFSPLSKDIEEFKTLKEHLIEYCTNS